jgi:hypothetical protein
MEEIDFGDNVQVLPEATTSMRPNSIGRFVGLELSILLSSLMSSAPNWVAN